jgi:hypothetical protein
VTGWQDPPAARVGFDDWAGLFETVPHELIERYRYCRRDQLATGGLRPWSTYLFPPQTFAVYGARHLARLKFDNSLAALRLWGFVQSESERLFRARQLGRRVVATMGDLGALPVLVNSLPELVAFYPDCTWWTPFAMESTVLLDAAAREGIGEATCFSRAALGAFAKHAYFPDPDLVIASSGASCDDYAGVEQLVAGHARAVLWLEEPLRRDCGANCPRTRGGVPYEPAAREFLVREYERALDRLGQLAGRRIGEDELRAGVRRANAVRGLARRVRELAYSDAVLPALETMLVEFGCLHGYSDVDEWQAVLEHLVATGEARAARGERVRPDDALRVGWVSPPADPLFLVHAEDRGARVVASEYVINQALEPIDEAKPPLEAVAESFLAASLIGSSRARAATVIAEAQLNAAEGFIISGILGGSHCAMETRLIADRVREELGLPVLDFDVPAPAREINRQLATRIDAFLEVVRERRR